MVKGKPVIDHNLHQDRLDFSSAGSNGCCLIGICTAGQLGVDLEMVGRKTSNPGALVRRYFSEAEQQKFSSLESDELDDAFLHTWACKEAVVKAAGHGIANQLCRFSVSIDSGADAQMLDIQGDDPGEWQLNMVRPSPDFVACVALRHHALSLEGFSLNPHSADQDA